MFTARNRQNAFAKRRRAQAEANAAPAPEPSTEPPADETTYLLSSETNAERLREAVTDIEAGQNLVEFPPSEEQTARGNVVLDVPPISAETQAKIDAIANRAIPPVAEADDDEQPAAEPEPKRGRGRPRPMATILRDGKVYDLLKAADEVEGVSKEALAISLGEKEQQVYSSLRQLTKEGRAETRYVKGHGYRWFALQAD